MTDTTNPDATAPEAAVTRSLSDIIGNTNADALAPEVIDSGEPAMAAPAPTATPATTAESPPATAPAPAGIAAANPDLAAKPEAQQPFWYRKEIEKERKARQALERELETLRGRPAQPAHQPQGAPDPLESPDQFSGYIEQRLETQRLVDRLERSEERLSDKLGDAVVDEVREWLTTRPDLEQWAMGQRDPWKAAHQQFTKEKLASEIGEDPNAWREAERTRIRQELEAEMGRDPQPAPAARPAMNPRAAPPPPSSTVRSAAPRDETTGRFAGPTPLKSAFKT